MTTSMVDQTGGLAHPAVLGQRALAKAFASFSEAAGSLERSYGQLQEEVARLRCELEQSNLELANSMEQNRHMRVRLDRILEALPCGVLVTEPDGRVSISNPETQRQIGVLNDSRLPGWLEDLLQQVPGDHSELEYSRGDAHTAWTAIRCAQLSTEVGGSSIFILQDITAAKRMEQERERLRQRQALVELAATLAHEIRNPLGSLELFSGLLANADLEPEPRRWVEHLQAGLRSVAATVNNVLQFHSEPAPELAPTDIGILLNSVYEFLQPLAMQGQVRMVLEHDLEFVLVAADRHRLQQVFFNLALNAFRFMAHGGVLKITGEILNQRRIRIAFQDSGAGISGENLKSIFHPGFTTRPGSPGLGLAVSKKIVEQHAGKIDVTSTPGEGATFTLDFPIAGATR
jgi:two-component system, sensor histidine kinase FlrB